MVNGAQFTATLLAAVSATAEVATRMPSGAVKVAVTVAFAAAFTVAGAVYRPVAETVPGPVNVNTGVAVELVTAAVNCCVCPWNIVADAGVKDSVLGGDRLTVTMFEVLVPSGAVMVD